MRKREQFRGQHRLTMVLIGVWVGVQTLVTFHPYSGRHGLALGPSNILLHATLHAIQSLQSDKCIQCKFSHHVIHTVTTSQIFQLQ